MSSRHSATCKWQPEVAGSASMQASSVRSESVKPACMPIMPQRMPSVRRADSRMKSTFSLIAARHLLSPSRSETS